MLRCFGCKSTKNLRAIHNQRRGIYRQQRVVSAAKVQKIWEQFTTDEDSFQFYFELFRLQKYKKFESNSQPVWYVRHSKSCCFGCKSTKNLRAIHNPFRSTSPNAVVVSAAKVQKIWEQFTTLSSNKGKIAKLFRLQKYKKFESNSQPLHRLLPHLLSCFGCKSTKNLRAIHNTAGGQCYKRRVVSAAKVQKIWEQFTTNYCQLPMSKRCFGCKSTKNLRAIHNERHRNPTSEGVVSAAKVQKIWEQFTTMARNQFVGSRLFRLQKYKKFESNSQPITLRSSWIIGCFGCKSTKNLRAIHNVSNLYLL